MPRVLASLACSSRRLSKKKRGGVRGTEDKFTISRACVVQVSLSDTQVHIHLHKLYPKLTHYIMYYFTKWDIDCLGTHYIIKNLYVRLSYFTQ